MKPGTVGIVLVTCPACGENLEASVGVTQLIMSQAFIDIHFDSARVPHRECTGRVQQAGAER